MFEQEKMQESIRSGNYVVNVVMKAPAIAEVRYEDRPMVDQSWRSTDELQHALSSAGRFLQSLPIHPSDAFGLVYSVGTDGAFLVGLARTSDRQPGLFDNADKRDPQKNLEKMVRQEVKAAKNALSIANKIVEEQQEGRVTTYPEFLKLTESSPSPEITLACLGRKSKQEHQIALNDELITIPATAKFPRTLDLGGTLQVSARVSSVDKENLNAKVRVESWAINDPNLSAVLQVSQVDMKLQLPGDALCLLMAQMGDVIVHCECAASIALDGGITEMRLLSIENKKQIAESMPAVLRHFKQVGFEF